MSAKDLPQIDRTHIAEYLRAIARHDEDAREAGLNRLHNRLGRTGYLRVVRLAYSLHDPDEVLL